MSIVESTNSKRNFPSARLGGLAGMALVSAAAFLAAPKPAHASMAWIETGDDSWFNTANWASGTVTGTLPESGGPLTGGVLDINANNATQPATGVLFDPANQISNGSYLAKIETGSVNSGTFYISNSNSSTSEQSAPNALTVLSGTLEGWAWTVGRDSSALVTLNGGTIIADGKLVIGSGNSAAGTGFVQGSGTFAYHGGTLIVKNQVQVAGGNNGNAVDTIDPTVGKFVIYNDGPNGSIQIANSVKIASNSSGTGSVGIIEFHYDLNPDATGEFGSNTVYAGNVRPLNLNINTTNSQLSLVNGVTNTTPELNLVVDSAVSVLGSNYQNLGLFHENTITGNSTFPKLFFATDGVTQYTQGATISSVFSGVTYSWTISYSGIITFLNTATSSYDSTAIAATGGNDVVLIGTSAVPEPSTMALLGGAGSLILARRRRKNA